MSNHQYKLEAEQPRRPETRATPDRRAEGAPSAIAEILASCEHSIFQLDNVLGELATQLSPVRSQLPLDPMTTKPADVHALCPLAETLVSINERIDRMRRDVLHLGDEIQL
jgi:hypothetical protein